jgi:hypothetical protein
METLPSTDHARVARSGPAGRRISARDSAVGGASDLGSGGRGAGGTSAWGGVGVLVVASEGSSGERLGVVVLLTSVDHALMAVCLRVEF